MPSGGTNTDRLRVVSWKKQVGDPVSRGDVLLEVETDKAMLEVESFARGTLLKQAVPEGDYATVGEVIAYIGSAQDAKELESTLVEQAPAGAGKDSQRMDANATRLATNDVTAPVTRSSGAVRATPAAKRAARELGVTLAEVYTSTQKEILRVEDVKGFAATRERGVEAQWMRYDLQPLTGMRRNIAERMQIGALIPTFSAEIEVDMGNCVRLRSEIKARSDGVNVAYHDIIAKCAAVACQGFPLVNASFSEQGIRVFRSVNVGIAVSLDHGLVVPVITDVGRKDLLTVARESAEYIRLVRTGKFGPKLLENGTFTISNLGGYPISRFSAILNPPQSCILAVGAIQTRPVWQEDKWRECLMVSVTATFDHRVVDGAYGAQFLSALKSTLERPKPIFDF
jgi:pyruvate dehydrogenase E2 component (dihydrolipoamide acetyltransferase)